MSTRVNLLSCIVYSISILSLYCCTIVAPVGRNLHFSNIKDRYLLLIKIVLRECMNMVNASYIIVLR